MSTSSISRQTSTRRDCLKVSAAIGASLLPASVASTERANIMSNLTAHFEEYTGSLPFVDTAQMIEIDRLVIERCHIDLLQMMENAGRNLADLSRRRFLEGNPVDKKIIVLAGRGANGGGAMVATRHLQNWGADVTVILAAAPSEFIDVPARQLEILQCLQVPFMTLPRDCTELQQQTALIVDGLVGYGLKGAPRGRTRDIIQWANSCEIPILSLDIPSGVDSTTGEVFDPAIRAEATMTLALPKKGLANLGAQDAAGEIYLADISVPPELLLGLGLEVGPVFARSEIVRLRL